MQARYVAGIGFLDAAEHVDDRGSADEEGDVVEAYVLERQARREVTQDDHGAADIEGRAWSAGMQSSAVEPGREVHGHVFR